MRRHRIAFCFLAALCAGCHCGDSLHHVSSTLVADPKQLDFGNQPIGVATPKTFTLTNNGSVIINVQSVAITSDARGSFSATLTAQTLQPAAQMTVTVNYKPTAVGSDTATAAVSSDSGEVDVPLTGTGQDLCANVTCPATGQGAVAACAGTCVAGQCQYPTGACTDPSGCVTNGTCDGHGHCTASCYGDSPPCCTTPPAAVCSDPNTLTIPVSPGHCDGAGNCQYPLPKTAHCNCGCAVQTGGQPACNVHWKLLAGAPQGAYSSVWSTTAGDQLWVSVINGTNAIVNAQTIYERVGGNWQQVGTTGQPTIPNAENPNCSGPGCGIVLTGDNAGNIYGAADCKDSTCSAVDGGGVWHDNSGTLTDEWFVLPGHICGGVTNPNIPTSPVVVVSGAPYALDNDPCGPQIVKGAAGSWTVAHGVTPQPQCQTPGSMWAASPSDFFVAWGCGAPNGTTAGAIWHWDGIAGHPDVKSYALPAQGEYADAMFGSSINDIWAVGTHRWHCTANCGSSTASWTQDPGTMPGTDQALWGNSTGSDYYVGGAYLDIFHWTTATNAWTEECVSDNGTGSNPSIYSIWGDSQGNVYAATSIGLMQRQ